MGSTALGGGQVYLERLRVPVLDLCDRGHVIEAVGQVVELLDAMRQPDGKLLGQELRGAEESTCTSEGVSTRGTDGASIVARRWKHTSRGLVAKLHHLPQAHARSGKLGIVPDGGHQPVRRLPRHGGGLCVSGSWKRLANCGLSVGRSD